MLNDLHEVSVDHIHIQLYSNKFVLPPSQIIRHSKNLGESKNLKFDQIYMIK
jgi:hypothetical protein